MIRTLFWWPYLLIFNFISHFQGGKIKNYILGFYLINFRSVFNYIIVLMCKDAYQPFSHDVVWSFDWVTRLSCSLIIYLFIYFYHNELNFILEWSLCSSNRLNDIYFSNILKLGFYFWWIASCKMGCLYYFILESFKSHNIFTINFI